MSQRRTPADNAPSNGNKTPTSAPASSGDASANRSRGGNATPLSGGAWAGARAVSSPRGGQGGSAVPAEGHCDVLVVGAGPAGLAAAIHAALRGRSVVVLDPTGSVQQKACGEGLMPAGVAALARMGVRLRPEDVWPLAGVAYCLGTLRAEARFDAAAPAMGVRRAVLSQALRGRAQALGVLFRSARLSNLQQQAQGVLAVTDAGTFYAQALVGADGLHSRVRRLTGLANGPGRAKRFGLRRHYACAPNSSFIEVHLGDGIEAYVTPVAADCVNVAFLTERPTLGFDAHLAAFPALAQMLAQAKAGAVAGAGPFWQRARRVADGRVALVGDAAGYVDAVTGEGVSLALLGAEAWAEAATAANPARAYARAVRPARAHYAWHARLLLACLRRRWLLRPALGLLARMPRLMRAWVQAAVSLPAPRVGALPPGPASKLAEAPTLG